MISNDTAKESIIFNKDVVFFFIQITNYGFQKLKETLPISKTLFFLLFKYQTT